MFNSMIKFVENTVALVGLCQKISKGMYAFLHSFLIISSFIILICCRETLESFPKAYGDYDVAASELGEAISFVHFDKASTEFKLRLDV